MEKIPPTKIDAMNPEILTSRTTELAEYRTSASTALELGALAVKFAHVERVPRYGEQRRENDAEHSFMLALVATELARELYPSSMNPGLISQYAIVHDLIEIKTGDVATMILSEDELMTKEATEHAALEQLLEQLPPYTRNLLYDYELQEDLEARFVRAVDKLLPVIVDIVGPGRQVMSEDYGITDIGGLEAAHTSLHERIAKKYGEFPELIANHAALCELFELEYEATQRP